MTAVQELPLTAIVAGNNDRSIFNPAEVTALAESIRQHGLAQPITVRPLPRKGHYEIVAGDRRFRAHQELGAATIPAIVRRMSDREAADVMLIENIQRVDLNPMDEARAYRKRREQFGASVAEIAAVASVSEGRVRSRLRLCSLIDEAQHLVQSGQLGVGYGEAMADLDRNRQLIALRSLNEAKAPTLAWFRSLCGQLLADQAQERLFNLEEFMRANAEGAATGDQPPSFPTAPNLPPMQGKMSVGATLLSYIAELLAGGMQSEAAVVGTVLDGLLRSNNARL
ncbi:MAG: ParB/RepB/Spo0J family partition protein [Dehalococcoidia bacterium]|nr:ParB/RepB/Spo0J family partition protein [Dehalococcoidia bacterium]